MSEQKQNVRDFLCKHLGALFTNAKEVIHLFKSFRVSVGTDIEMHILFRI